MKLSKELDQLRRRQNPRPNKVASNLMAPFGMLDLRCFWPSSSYDDNQLLYDVSGQARHMTANNAPASYLHNEKIPFIEYDGTQYHHRNYETALDIAGNLTMGLWAIVDTLDDPALLVHDNGVQTSYGLDISSSLFQFYVQTTAPATRRVLSSVTLVAGVPYFVCGRFTSGSKIDIFVNGVWDTTATADTTIAVANSPLYYGARNGANHLTGKLTWGFITANAASDTQIRQMYDCAKSAFGVYQ